MGVWDPLSAGVGRGVAHYLEGKRRKEEKSRYDLEREAKEKERLLREEQIRQQMTIALQQAEREKTRMAPGGIETRKILSAPYGIGTEEARPKVIPEGIGHKLERLSGTLAEKQIAGYETPAQIREVTGFETPEQRRLSEQSWEEKMANLRQQHALELAGLREGAEEEAIPFDESGAFNPQIFYNIAKDLFGEFRFRDVYDNIGLEEVRNKIRLEAVGAYGQNDPTKVQQIESSLDEWLRILFQIANTAPEGEKDQPFVNFLEKAIGWFKERTPGPLTIRSKAPGVPKEGPPARVFPGGMLPPGGIQPSGGIEKKERKIRDLFSWTR